MGIDYLTCHNCGETFPDCGSYVSCECGESWCDEECAKEDGFIEEHCTKYNVYGYDELEECADEHEDCGDYCADCEYYKESSCNICRKEDFEDYELLNFALDKLHLTRQELISKYKEED